MERVVFLPKIGDSQLAQALLANQIDHGFLIVNVIKQTVPQSPKLTTHTGREAPFGYTDWWPLSLYVNTEKKPFDDKDVRWAVSSFLDRKQIIDVAYEGAGTLWPLPFPSYPPLRPYVDAAKPLLDKYPTLEFNASKGNQLMQGKGYKKNAQGMWTDGQGNPIKMEILGFSFMSNIGPVVAEQLRRAGFDATFSMPPDAGDQFTQGKYTACIFGHGGSVADPYDTLRLYQTASQVVPGAQPNNFPRWKNADYDKVVDEVYSTPMEEKAKLLELVKKALEIWLPELPDVQLVEFYHNIAMNETYWKGWPSKADPYINEASWHLTFQLVLNRLEPVQ
jgi:peptide/nickel transport system substrate-binding protein